MSRSRLPLHALTIAAAAVAFVALFNWTMQTSESTKLLLPYIVAFLALAVCTLTTSALSLRAAHSEWSAAQPSISGLLATHLPLAILGYGSLLLLYASENSPHAVTRIVFAIILAMGSLLAARIWVFITPIVRDVAYEELPADFYHDTTKSEQVGAFRAWYHGGRYQELQAQVHSLYTEGDSIYDFGCGGAQWNQSKLPVIGVDVSRGLLQYGKDRGQLRDIVVAELDKTGLPDACADIIIISEVIEHIVDPVKVLHEIHRCLKPGGRLIATVPWDTPFSPFFWLFNVQCFYRGHIVGEEYYKQRCGHINHFSLRRLKKLLTQTGFSVQRMYRFRGFLLYSISTK